MSKRPPHHLCVRAKNGTLPATAEKWIKQNLSADHWIRVGVEQQQMPVGAAILILCARPSLTKEQVFQAVVEIPGRQVKAATGSKNPRRDRRVGQAEAMRVAERNVRQAESGTATEWEGTLWLRYGSR